MQTPDLSQEFNPQPKVYKLKKMSKPIKQLGKKGLASKEAVEQMKKDFAEIGITTCEAKLPGCWHNKQWVYKSSQKRNHNKLNRYSWPDYTMPVILDSN